MKLITVLVLIFFTFSCNSLKPTYPLSISQEVNSSIIDGFGYSPGMYLLKESSDSTLSYLQQ